MTHQVTDRELLQDLAARPLGTPELQKLASQYSPDQTPPPELREVSKRCSKVWLPAGKRSSRGRGEREAEQSFYARQTDIEDAVEAAGGVRGSVKAA